MTAPANTDDGGDHRPLTPAQQATVDRFRGQLDAQVSTDEPTAHETATQRARRRAAAVLASYRQVREVFDCYRAAGFTTDQALRLIAYVTASSARE